MAAAAPSATVKGQVYQGIDGPLDDRGELMVFFPDYWLNIDAQGEIERRATRYKTAAAIHALKEAVTRGSHANPGMTAEAIMEQADSTAVTVQDFPKEMVDELHARYLEFVASQRLVEAAALPILNLAGIQPKMG